MPSASVSKSFVVMRRRGKYFRKTFGGRAVFRATFRLKIFRVLAQAVEGNVEKCLRVEEMVSSLKMSRWWPEDIKSPWNKLQASNLPWPINLRIISRLRPSSCFGWKDRHISRRAWHHFPSASGPIYDNDFRQDLNSNFFGHNSEKLFWFLVTIALDHLHVNAVGGTRKLFTPRRSSLLVSGTQTRGL